MIEEIIEHYKQVGLYSYAGPYQQYYESLPDDITELGRLICSQVIHRVTLEAGNTGANANLIYGDMTKFPWYRLRCEDDVFLTATSMTAELFRLDERGFFSERATEHKIVVTCRYVSVLMSAILKSKGIPCRSRAGFAPYVSPDKSMDHWINQYWCESETRWITFDADGFFDDEELGFSAFDIPYEKFNWAANTWLDIRNEKVNGKYFVYADSLGTNGLKAAIRAIFYDFHALMNNEISYQFQPSYITGKFDQLSEIELEEIDQLAELMLEPDHNYRALVKLWKTNQKYRILSSPLVNGEIFRNTIKDAKI